MSGIPLHLQRRFEQRWAARFVRPVAWAAPKSIDLKGQVELERSLDDVKTPIDPGPQAGRPQATTNDNQMAWPLIPYPEGWYGA
jgi:hypothetical protein